MRATSNNSGAKQSTVNYASAYGKSSINAEHFGFTGERFDADSNTLYLRARNYDPVNEVFLSRDTKASVSSLRELTGSLRRSLFGIFGCRGWDSSGTEWHWYEGPNGVKEGFKKKGRP